jgi:hypothetical protein
MSCAVEGYVSKTVACPSRLANGYEKLAFLGEFVIFFREYHREVLVRS